MDFQWIAAVLNPRDVAPHPNFSSIDRPTPAGLLASLLRGRLTMHEEVDDYLATPSSPPDDDYRLIEAARRALTLGERDGAAYDLGDLSKNLRDLAKASAAGILASVTLSQIDDFEAADAILATLLDRASNSSGLDDDRRLLLAALHQQRALRQFDRRKTSPGAVTEVLQHLDAVSAPNLSQFPVTAGISWTSERTLSLISHALRDAAVNLQSSAEGIHGQTWTQAVRAVPPELVLRLFERTSSGYHQLVQATFDKSAASSTVRFGLSDRGDQDLHAAHTGLELLGHPRARVLRQRLGVLRALAVPGAGEDWKRREAIRLLRQARDYKNLAVLLRVTRSGGPPEALRYDAQQVSRNRSDYGRGELMVLANAASLLPPNEASAVLSRLLATGSVSRQAESRQWGLETTWDRVEHNWIARVELAAASGETSQIADLLLADVEQATSGDELVDRAYVRAFRRLEWHTVAPVSQDSWAKWATESTLFPLLRKAVRELGSARRHAPPGARDDIVEYRINLEDAAEIFNRSVNTGDAVPAEITAQVVEVLERGLKGLRQEAAAGVFGFGGVDTADLSVGYALEMGVEELWPAIVGFLGDLHVARRNKAAAFDRLARRPASLQPRLHRTLRSRAEALLQSGVADFESPIVPFPQALRCLIALHAIDEGRAWAACAQLAAASETAARVEGARTVTTALRRSSLVPTWEPTLALQLSFDEAHGVRAEAGRALALYLSRAGEFKETVLQRLRVLLGEEASLVPLLVIRGLEEAGSDATASLRLELAKLSEEHGDAVVRDEAAVAAS